MKKKINVEFGVGLVVILLILSLSILIFKVVKINDNSLEGSNFEISAYFQNIGSLKPGAPVKISGVTVGKVNTILLDSSSFEAQVVIGLNDKYQQLPDDTAAAILTQGILGSQYLGLTPGSSDIYLEQGGAIEFTQSAIVLESLISKLLTSFSDKK